MRSLKRYRDYNTYLKEIFGERVQKISLDAGLSCPNRDGTLSTKGCIFCDNRGSGTGQSILQGHSISEQITRATIFLKKRYKAQKFIAYFQSFSNTYAPVSHLKSIYDEALLQKQVVGLSVATRPDCVDDDNLGLLASYRKDHLVWLELGLQSSHDITLAKINRGHDAACFEKSIRMAEKWGLSVCVHVILGLPDETRKMMLETAGFLSRLPVQGIKIHLMYIVEGTPLAGLYQKGGVRCLERDEYAERVVDFLELIPPDVVIQRLTGDPQKSELIAPLWALEKSKNLKRIQETFERRNTWQGKKLGGGKAGRR